MADPDRLAEFYLGRHYDLAASTPTGQPLLYDARHLTTHAVVVGMTGSGKTGLAITLLEEAALDGVPSLVLDPKGDLTNLLLTFPDLRPDDFQPWLNADDARRAGLTLEAYAEQTAAQWRQGLAAWGLEPERIARLKQGSRFAIYTPGTDAGIPISIVQSLAAPDRGFEADAEALAERISGLVSALLGLLGLAADPLRDREHILLSHIIEHAWRQGQGLDLAGLIAAIQTPPVRQLGVFDIEAAFPEKERRELAMRFNALVAAPSFRGWLQGVPLDIPSLLRAPDGRPQVSIFSIAHLGDDERMFFVTLLLEQVLTWLRTQPGTTSLRALLVFDEVFGFLPPVAEPPSKRPLLTLLKQARAYGLGLVVATQNPVDLDYKSLTNAGTWFIGKLQTERDKLRLIEGLTHAARFDNGAASRIDRALSALPHRVFLLHNVHTDRSPAIFQTRWSLSYLRGPLTRAQISELMAAERSAASPPAGAPVSRSAAPPPLSAPSALPANSPTRVGLSSRPPALPPRVPQTFLPARTSLEAALRAIQIDVHGPVRLQRATLVYTPEIVGLARVRFFDRKSDTDESRLIARRWPVPAPHELLHWDTFDPLDLRPEDLTGPPVDEARFVPLPAGLSDATRLREWARAFQDTLYRSESVTRFYNRVLKQYSGPGESRLDFIRRLEGAARQARTAEVDALEEKYAARLRALQKKLQREELELEEDREEAEGRRRTEWLYYGESALSFLMGSKRIRSISTASRNRRLTREAEARIEQTEKDIEQLEAEIRAVRDEARSEVAEITARWAEAARTVEEYVVTPRKSDIAVMFFGVGWVPCWDVEWAGRRSEDVEISRVEAL